MEKMLLGITNEHIKKLDSLVDKKRKNFKNKSAIVRMLLDALCGIESEPKLIAVIGENEGVAFAIGSDDNENVLSGCSKVSISAIKDGSSKIDNFELTISNKQRFR